MKKYLLDTNLYIDAFRDPDEGARFLVHYRELSPRLSLSAIVVQELLAGARSPADADSLRRHVLDLFERTGRIVTPSYDAWKRAGLLLRELASKEGLVLAEVSKGFVNDILIALSCREAGLTLLTRNLADFRRIRRHVRFDFAAPWPTSH